MIKYKPAKLMLLKQGRVKGSVNKFKPIQDDPTEIEHLQDVLIVRIEEALFFANTGKV
jgi:MFS superfamily sulfate permease-like transporter